MSKPWMPLYVGSFIKKTSHLSALETGAYILLILSYWANGGLPTDDKRLARIAKLTDREWMASRDVLAAFFVDDWRHERVDEELAHAEHVSNKRKAARAQRGNKDPTIVGAKVPTIEGTIVPTVTVTVTKKGSEATASDASASDPRTKLFSESLKTLARITGKTPDSCRSIVGKWLKSVNDEAIHVIAAIEDAERNRIADPVAWINRTLNPRGTHAKPAKNGLGAALENLGSHIDELDRGEAWRETPPRLLSSG
jgi:uncharacterized protein YdaU (DUF1376 family)